MKTTKTTLTLMLASLATMLTASLGAAPEPTTAIMYPVTAVTRDGKAIIKPGTWRADVRELIGVPQEHLTTNVWVYRRFHASHPAADADGCDRLVIAFKDGYVSSLRMANARAQAVIVARVNDGASEHVALGTVPKVPPATMVAKKD